MAVFSKTKTAVLITAAIFSAQSLAETKNIVPADTMVVTATGFQQRIQDSAASISVVTRQQIENKAYRDVTDALKDVPGVVVTGGGSKSDISIRGMAAKYTLILVNGKRVDTRSTRPNSDGSGIEQGWLPPLAAIERIEVVRGPMSSLYGSDAMGGVINIITRKVGKAWAGSLRADTTLQEDSKSGDMLQTNAYASGPLIDGLLGLKVSGLLSHRSEDKIVNGYNEQRMRNGAATLTLTPDDNNEFDFELGHYVQDRNATPGYSIKEMDKNSDVQYDRNNYSITHNGYYDFGNSTSYVQRDETRNPSRKMKSVDNVFNTQTSFLLDSHTLILGGQYRFEELYDDNNQLSSAKDLNKLTRWNWALFAEDEWQMTNDFALTGGIRMDQDQNYGTHWTPRLYGVWHLAEEWTLKGGVSAGYRSPDLRQATENWGQITGGRGDPAIILGNANLKPETSVSEEIAVLWDNQADLNAGVTLFNTDFRDKITEVRKCTDSTGNASGQCVHEGSSYKYISERINVDEATLRGVEATFNWDITEAWTLGTNYTFTQSKQKSGDFAGKPLNQMPKHMLNATLDWKTTEDLATWIRANYRGKTSEYLDRTSIGATTPSYTFVDLGANYRLTKDLRLMGGVYNLLDKRVDIEVNNKVLDGRRYMVGVNYDF
ncbi:tonB dependent receptor family protein [Yersinia ruckeri ATCC 29473]|uniref:Putative outer membrane receptor n=2 Tax=Yersinia ruckeri TaxID=29486 RepID=A0A0A8VKF9_YERRU|nr:tonB dependent receptor family protein [Yersinia ruckeri ATCC 29473]QTD77211.1 TonB-dependent outer membrane receptor [Yersinia ruckeri]CEK28096.1 TonB-dependent receptor; Outer membrane receptor for ferrienterochelin and colicins [Yersinia ruckeri]CNI38095.1 putative outer membrane receptor [Yersinia ruckeri]SUP97887.1 putative outer membrane receptor [Yersinia ruckeri]